jgi:hypothetical protein
MQMRNFAAVAALTAAVVGITAGTATAAPTAAPAAYPQKAVHYTVGRTAHSTVITASDGQFKVVTDPAAGRQLEVLDNAGTTVATEVPLTFRINHTVYNIDAAINGHTATLTPSMKPVGTVNGPLPVARPISSLKPVSESFTPRDQTALSLLGSRATTSSLVAAVTGAVLGGTAGCILGALTGASTTALTGILAPLSLGTAGIGCITGITILGSVGTVAGLIFIGGPLILFSAIQYFSTVLSPCLTPGAYCKDPSLATH